MKKLLVIFGGNSSEHDVSCKSVQNVIEHIDDSKYKTVLVGITKEGEWLLVDSIDQIRDQTWTSSDTHACLLPDEKRKALYIEKKGMMPFLERIDVIFPVLHGKNGEDGCIQGLFELAHIPYVGCGVLASAVSMDKLYTKLVVDQALRNIHVRQASYVSVIGSEIEKEEENIRKVENAFPYPVFVKPSNAGSSCGVTKAENREELKQALRKAYEYDRKILIEECIVGREVECAVLRAGDMQVHSSGIGEIVAAADFYDYDAKYNNPDSLTLINPNIPEEDKALIKQAAETVFQAVDGYGLSRVDFFLTDKGLVFNEINTLPGFTAISLYPMLWEAEGLGKRALIEKLLESALERPGF